MNLFYNFFVLAWLLYASEGFSQYPHILAIGDWGVSDENLEEVADLAVSVHKRKNFNFAITVGDNFYEHGVSDDHDRQFIDKFLNVFKALPFAFFPTLGNHDYGNYGKSFLDKNFKIFQTQGNWQAQVDFTDVDEEINPKIDRYNRKWQMPDRFYSVEYGKADLFAIDTDPSQESHYNIHVAGDQTKARKTYWKGQLGWLVHQLTQSNAEWKVVYGHHPLISDGPHGDNSILLGQQDIKGKNIKKSDLYKKDSLYKILCLYADLYVCGHDHSLQLHQIDCSAFDKPPLFQIITGAGGVKPIGGFKKARAIFSENKSGFVALDFASNSVDVTFHFIDAKSELNELFTLKNRF